MAISSDNYLGEKKLVEHIHISDSDLDLNTKNKVFEITTIKFPLLN